MKDLPVYDVRLNFALSVNETQALQYFSDKVSCISTIQYNKSLVICYSIIRLKCVITRSGLSHNLSGEKLFLFGVCSCVCKTNDTLHNVHVSK